MQYHVAQNGIKIGPLEKEEVLRRLIAGELKPNDLGWHEGLAEWEPLSKLIPPPQPGPASSGVFVSAPFPSPASAPALAQPPQSSGVAIASMICGILGLILWLPCIPAVILGHMGLSAIKKSAGALTGRGMAISGLVMGYMMIALIPLIAILAAMAVPAFNQVQARGNQMKAVSNAKQLVLAMRMYAAEHDDNFPPTLEAVFDEQIIMDRRVLEFPAAMNVPGQGWEYRGNGVKVTNPGNTIVLISKQPDRTKMMIVARCDGSVSVEKASAVP